MSRLEGVWRTGSQYGYGQGRCRRAWAVLAAGAVLSVATGVGLTVSPGTAGAAFPGANGRIACEGVRKLAVPGTSTSEIFSVNPDGSDEKVLSDNTTFDGDATFSPDGTKIAFAAQRDNVAGQPNNTDVYVANNDGDLGGPDLKRLTVNAATDKSPSWSPDGSEIVFHSTRSAAFSDGGPTPANDTEIYKMSAATGETGGLTRLTTNRGQDAIPSWSPDGTKIAFQSLRAGISPFNLEIFTMNPDGTGATNISNNPGTPEDPAVAGRQDSDAIDRDATWSPDSRQVAFTSTRDNVTPSNQNLEIYKVNRDGSNPTSLTLNASGDTPDPEPYQDYDAAPTWSPDGKRIVFTSGRSSNEDGDKFFAYTMDAGAGEAAGGVQAVAEIGQAPAFNFQRCGWQSVAPAAAPVPPRGYPLPPSGGGGGIPPRATVCPNSRGVRVIGRTNSGGRVFQGTRGNDRICGTSAGDVITGNGGRDVISGGGGNDRINGGSGNDRVNGGSGKDLVSGSSGNDSILGGSGNDRINGNSGKDRVNGNSGNDRLNGSTGNDVVSGSSGRDVISGSSGNDRLSGNSGNDRINGNSGNDRISGGSGKDRLKGGSGNDRIVGGAGRDRISGGSGRNQITQ